MLDEISERNQQIAQQYLEGRSAPSIARDHGLSLSSVRVILREQGVTSSKRTPRPDVVEAEKKPISMKHKKIGERLIYYRSMTKGQGRAEASRKLGWSTQKIAMTEAGKHDLTLTDLEDLTSYMGLNNITELLQSV